VDFDIKPELALLQRKLKPSKNTAELSKESIKIALFYGIVAFTNVSRIWPIFILINNNHKVIDSYFFNFFFFFFANVSKAKNFIE